MTKEAFRAGMKMLVAVPWPYRQVKLTSELLATYYAVLGERFTEESWMAAVQHVLESAKQFPLPADFLAPQAAAEDAEALARAANAFWLISTKGTEYHPVTGTKVTERRVKDLAGEMAWGALRAFVTVGGADAFNAVREDPQAEEFLRQRFVKAFVAATKATQPAAELPTSGIGPAAAGAILDRITARLTDRATKG